MIFEMLRQQGRVHNLELAIRIKGGELHHILYSLDQVDIGGVPSYLSHIVDVTPLVEARQALMAASLRLSGHARKHD